MSKPEAEVVVARYDGTAASRCDVMRRCRSRAATNATIRCGGTGNGNSSATVMAPMSRDPPDHARCDDLWLRSVVDDTEMCRRQRHFFPCNGSPWKCIFNKSQDIARRNGTLPADWGIPLVHPPGECFWSGAGVGFVVDSATDGGRAASLTSGFDFRHGVSYWCSVVALRCTVAHVSEGIRQTNKGGSTISTFGEGGLETVFCQVLRVTSVYFRCTKTISQGRRSHRIIGGHKSRLGVWGTEVFQQGSGAEPQ